MHNFIKVGQAFTHLRGACCVSIDMLHLGYLPPKESRVVQQETLEGLVEGTVCKRAQDY